MLHHLESVSKKNLAYLLSRDMIDDLPMTMDLDSMILEDMNGIIEVVHRHRHPLIDAMIHYRKTVLILVPRPLITRHPIDLKFHQQRLIGEEKRYQRTMDDLLKRSLL